MSFDSFAAFLAMGGHGLYVWMSYGAAAIMFAYNIVAVILRRRRFFRQGADLERRRAAAGAAARAPAAVDDLQGETNPS